MLVCKEVGKPEQKQQVGTSLPSIVLGILGTVPGFGYPQQQPCVVQRTALASGCILPGQALLAGSGTPDPS